MSTYATAGSCRTFRALFGIGLALVELAFIQATQRTIHPAIPSEVRFTQAARISEPSLVPQAITVRAAICFYTSDSHDSPPISASNSAAMRQTSCEYPMVHSHAAGPEQMTYFMTFPPRG